MCVADLGGMRDTSSLRLLDANLPRTTRRFARRPRALLSGLVVTAALAQACLGDAGDDEIVDSSPDAVGASRPTYTAAFLAKAPKIDGVLREYDALPSIRLANADGATVVRAGWTADALYVAFDVDDRNLLPASGGEAALWNGDGVEVMLDTRKNRASVPDQDDIHLIVTSAGKLADARAWTDYGFSSGATVRAMRRSRGYRVEMRIPFAQIGVTPGAGVELGFNVAYNDRDVVGGPLVSKDFAGLASFANPSGWGTLVLGASPSAPPPLPPSDPPPPPPPGFTCPAGSKSTGALPNGSVPGTLSFPNPTLHNISIDWRLDGDADGDGQVEVHYRVKGQTSWRTGMPLRRVLAGATFREGYTFPNRHAGSIFDLEPGTTYEIELRLLDPDGGCQVRKSTVTTRPVEHPRSAR